MDLSNVKTKIHDQNQNDELITKKIKICNHSICFILMDLIQQDSNET